MRTHFHVSNYEAMMHSALTFATTDSAQAERVRMSAGIIISTIAIIGAIRIARAGGEAS